MKTFDLDSLVRQNVLKMKPYSSARDEFKDIGEDMIFLDANENPYNNGVNRYPDPRQRDLKHALAAVKEVPADQIVLGNGSDEVLDLLFRIFCYPEKDNIITLPPTYGMYKVLAETNAVENREVTLTADFQPNVDGILQAADEQTKMIFVCSPNNPTSNAFKEVCITQLLERFSGIVVIDEAYIDFANNESWISRLSRYPNLIVTQTLSKAYGMAGIRLGICYASKPIVALLNKIKPPYNVNELTQKTALKRVLSHNVIEKEVAMILQERERLAQKLQEIEVVTTVFPSDANFLLVKVDNAPKRYKELIEKGIVVRNRSNQILCENTLRFTVGTVEENNKLIKTLNNLTV